MMELHDLVELVEEMRVAQKEYFRTKLWSTLEKAKAREKKVDEFLLRYRDGQKRLFD